MKKLLMAILLSTPVSVHAHTIVETKTYDVFTNIPGSNDTVLLLDGFDPTLGTLTSVNISITSSLELTGELPASFITHFFGSFAQPYEYTITVANDFALGFIPEHTVIFQGGDIGGFVRRSFTASSTSTMSMTFDSVSDLTGLGAAVTTNSSFIPPSGAGVW